MGPRVGVLGRSTDFPHPGGVTVDKLPNFLVPQFPHLEREGKDPQTLMEWCEE